jgi:regulator of replication initiation timing
MKHKSTALSLTLARINIGLVINKLIVRQKHASTSVKQREGIQTMLQDLESALEVLKSVSKENEEMYRLNYSLHIENLKLKKQLYEATKTEEMQEL